MDVRVNERYSAQGLISYPLKSQGLISYTDTTPLSNLLLLDGYVLLKTSSAQPVRLTQVTYTGSAVDVQLTIGSDDIIVSGSTDSLNTVSTDTQDYYIGLTLGPHDSPGDGTYTVENGGALLEPRTIVSNEQGGVIELLRAKSAGTTSYTSLTADSPIITAGRFCSITNNSASNSIIINTRPSDPDADPCQDNFADALGDIAGETVNSVCTDALFSVNGLEPDWGGDFAFASGPGITVEPDPDHHAIAIITGQSTGEVAGRSTHTPDGYSYVQQNISYDPPESTSYVVRLLEEGGREETLFSYFTNAEIIAGIRVVDEVDEATADITFQNMLENYYG